MTQLFQRKPIAILLDDSGSWERFGIWLAIGLAVHFLYGFEHSKLRH